MGRTDGSLILSVVTYLLIIACIYDRPCRVLAADNKPLGFSNNKLEQHRIVSDIHTSRDDVHEEISPLRLHSMDGVNGHKMGQEHNHDHGHVRMSHMDHMSSTLNVFLIEKDLKIGHVMPIYFPYIKPSSFPHFLPKEEADSIPFSPEKLPYLLQFFSIPDGSPQAKSMEVALKQCEFEPIEGESKLCATSLESMLDFVQTKLRVGKNFEILRTVHHRKPSPTSQTHPLLTNYTILSISRKMSGNKMVACHTMLYPYTVFYCHHLESQSKVFKVSVISEYGQKVEAVVVCHMDTSAWNPNHVSFRMLGIKPGTDPVCHFFPEDHLVWVPSAPSI